MSSLVAIAYVSSATRLLTPGDLDALLLDARAFNAVAGVSGALLHQDGSFFQYIEGPEAGITQVYARIRCSRTHRGLIELVRAPVARRHFSAWSMGFAEPVTSELQAIAQARWHAQHQAVAAQEAATPGLALLLSFWRRAQAEPVRTA